MELFDKSQYTSQNHPLAINIGRVLREKAGKHLPRPVIAFLERLIHQREINDILYRHGHLAGKDFLEALVKEFRLDIDWVHAERLPASGRCIFVSNHPLGGLDGISLSYMLAECYGDVRYMVSDLLYYLKPLQPVFLPVNNRQGKQAREQVEMLQQALATEVPIGSFPAGSCSRIFDGKLQDKEWRKTFVSQAIASERDVVPLHFVGQNSRHFYWVWKLKNLLGMKFDPGQALLPDELFRARGSRFRVLVGEPISWQSLRDGQLSAQEEAQRIRAISYQLREEYDQHQH